MTQTTLSVLLPGSDSNAAKSGLNLFDSDTSLRAGEAQTVDPQALDAAVQFAALLLEQQPGQASGGDGGNTLPVAGGNRLPTTGVDVSGGEAGLLENNAALLDELRRVLPDDAAKAISTITQQIAWPNTANIQVNPQPVADGAIPVLSVPSNAALPAGGDALPLKSPDRLVAFNATADNSRAAVGAGATGLAELLVNSRSGGLAGAGIPDKTAVAPDTPLPSTQSASNASPGVLASPVLQFARAARAADREGIQSLNAIDIRLPESALSGPAARVAPLQTAAPLTAAPALSESGVPQLLVDAKIGDPDWSRQFAERVGWVIHARLGSAQVRLNPEHLGPVEMSIEVDDNNTRVQFVAGQPLTRDAIENSLPRLRELLEQQGMQLADADVRDAPKEHADNGDNLFAEHEAPEQLAATDDTPSPDDAANGDRVTGVLAPSSLVDTYV